MVKRPTYWIAKRSFQIKGESGKVYNFEKGRRYPIRVGKLFIQIGVDETRLLQFRGYLRLFEPTDILWTMETELEERRRG